MNQSLIGLINDKDKENYFMDIPKKVFVSYKYSDVVEGRENSFNFRDKLIEDLGDNGLIHKGEDGESYDLSDYTNQQIVSKIGPYVKNSSTTLVLLSPNAKHSEWIPWEISRSLKKRAYKNEANMTRNGIIGVYLPLNQLGIPEQGGSYDFYRYRNSCGTITHHTDKLPEMIKDNSFNLRGGSFQCSNGCCDEVYNSEDGSYIELIEWDEFINHKEKYIARAWKRRNNFDDYETRLKLEGGK